MEQSTNAPAVAMSIVESRPQASGISPMGMVVNCAAYEDGRRVADIETDKLDQWPAKGEDFIVYALMDFVVDSYFPIVTSMQDEVSAIENRVFQDTFDQSGVEHIYDLRSDLLTLRNVVLPLIDICNRMMRFDVPLIDRDTYLY